MASMNKYRYTTKEIEDMKRKNNIEELKAQMDVNMRNVTVMRKLYQEKQEVDMEEALARARESAGWRVDELKQEEILAYEMDKATKQEIKNQKLTQRVWEAKEIRDLQKILKSAYNQKELMLSNKLGRDYKKALEKMEDDWYIQSVLQKEASAKQLELQAKQEIERKKQEYKHSLQDQIIDNHKLKIAAQIKKMEEVALINDAVRTAMQEDMREEEEEQKRKECIKEEIKIFKKAREMWINRERKVQEIEDKKIDEYLEELTRRESELQRRNLESVDNRRRAQGAVIERVRELDTARTERERIAEILLEEEARVKAERVERERMEKKQAYHREAREVFKIQLEMKMKEKEEEKRRDMEYANMVKANIEEENRKEQEALKQKKEMKMKYGEDLKRNLTDLHKLKTAEMLLRIKEEEGLKAERQEQIRLVDEERRKLLNEHIPNLVGFLPPGTIKDTDLPLLSPEVQALFKKKQ